MIKLLTGNLVLWTTCLIMSATCSGCGEGAKTVKPSNEPIPSENAQEGKLANGTWRVWTGGTLYGSGSPITVIVQTKITGDEKPKIRSLRAALYLNMGQPPILEQAFDGTSGTVTSPGVWTFRYDDLFSKPLPDGELKVCLEVLLDDNQRWSVTLPITVMSNFEF